MLITNEAKVSPIKEMQSLVINLLPGAKTRIETLEDREHTVIPMVMLTEGVHHGSGGAVYYTADELQKTPAIWNQKPVVVYHPAGSACDPDIVNNRKVGVIMNTQWDAKAKRLKAEAWIEKPKADKVDNRIFEAISKNEMMEVSTGLFVDLEESPGEWNGEEYIGIARNLRADHLAVLPDKIGACSIKDGAGLLRNELKKGTMAPKEMLKRLTNILGITENEMSFENTRSAIQTMLRKRLNVGDKGPWVWVEAVYSNFFVYDNGEGKLFLLGYSASDTGVSLSEDAPKEVFRVTEYRTVDGAKFVGNRDQKTEAQSDMNKQQKITAILAANIGWSDAKALEPLSDQQIDSIHNGIQKQPAAPAPGAATTNQTAAPAAPAPAATVQTPTTTTTNSGQSQQPLTMEEWRKTAPAEVVAAFDGIKNTENVERASLIEKITKNEVTKEWTKEELTPLPIANLRKLAKMGEAQVQADQFPGYQPALAANFAGMAPTAPVANEGAPVKIEPLTAPVLNFRKEAAGKGKETAAAA